MKKVLIAFGLGTLAFLIYNNYKNSANKNNGQLSMSQEDANKLASKIAQLYKDANEKYGALTYQMNAIKNEMISELYKGGYRYENGIAVKIK